MITTSEAHGTQPNSAQTGLVTDAPLAAVDLVLHWAQAWNAGDGEALAALYAPHGSYEDVPTAQVSTGRAAIARFIDHFVDNTRGARITIDRVAGTSHHLVAEWHLSAVHAGLFGPAPAADGKTFSSAGATVFTLGNDHDRPVIAASRDYYSIYTWMADLALVPPIRIQPK